jgi:lipoyl(octanoyl) transferase
MRCEIHDLGLMEYQPAWDLQNRFAAEIARGERPPTLLLLEHPHTYTFGRKGRVENLLWDEAQLKERAAAVYWIDRGGDVTYHGPGQLVGYPLIPLGKLDQQARIPQVDYIGYVRKLEKVLIEALAGIGLVSGQLNGKTGVWVQADVASRCSRCRPEDRKKPAKIAAVGVKVDTRGITRHGFALNVNPDMSYFDGIIPCGIADYPVVSLADLCSPAPLMDKVKTQIMRAFGDVFAYEMTQVRQEKSGKIKSSDTNSHEKNS